MLEIAGLNGIEERVYLTLLDLPPVTVAEATHACGGADGVEVAAVLDTLVGKGLLTQPSRDRYAPVAPQVGVGGLLSRREAELQQAQAALARLAERYRAVPRDGDGEGLVQVIVGPQHTVRRCHDALASARRQVRLLCRPQPGAGFCGPGILEAEAICKHVPVRVVHDQAGLCSPDAIARRWAEVAAGAQLRTADEVPVRLLLIDHSLALMPSRSGLTDGLIVAYGGVLMDALSALFERIWDAALLLGLDAATAPGSCPPVLHNTTTRAVLGLLSTGLTDQAIARRLCCSERTVQRHVQRLTEATGARTRFQAALHIGHHNWTT